MAKKKTPNTQRNHVAQHSWEQNTHQVHRDRKNDYKRHDKHKKGDKDLPYINAHTNAFM